MGAGKYHHGDLRTALLERTLELIREVGSEGFTLREVSRRAGVSHTAAYRHFRDKEDVTAAIAQEGFDLLAAEMRRAADLVAGGRAYVAFAMRRPEHFRVMFATDLDAKRHPDARKSADAAFAGLLALVRAAFPHGDTLTLARMAWSQVHGIASLAIGRQFRFRTQTEVLAFAEESMRVLSDGLAKRR
jgi:AcrR family transcriptional regulator